MSTKIRLSTIAILFSWLICLQAFAAGEKSSLQYAKGFTVESRGDCKLITVQPAWQKKGAGFRYLLVPRNRAVPKDHPPAQIIRIPVQRVVSLSTTHLAYIDAAGMVDRLVGLAAHRPRTITGAPFQGQWWIARGDSFVARYIADAGGDYVWSDQPGTGSLPLDVEAVYERALTADVWLNTGSWKKVGEARAADPRFATIPALQHNRMFNNNKRLNGHGGNDYWESGILRPDVVLADLVAILHPELLPVHDLVYYRRLER